MPNKGYLIERITPILISLILVILFTLPTQAQFSDNIDIALEANRERLTIGDSIFLTLTIEHPATYRAIIPPLEMEWGDLEIRSQSAIQTQANEGGGEITQQFIEATLFKVGHFQTPAFQITLRDEAGQTVERVVPQIVLTLESVLPDEEAELQGLKDQASLPVPPLWPWLLFLSLVLIILLGLLIWFYIRLRKQVMSTPPTVVAPPPVLDTRLPYEIALAELARIEALDLPGQGRFKEYYTLVTTCLRQYLLGEFDIPTLDYTTTEIKRSLKETNMLPQQTIDTIRLLEEGDLVKFARFVPERAEAYHYIPQVRDLIDAISLEPEESAQPTDDSETQSQKDNFTISIDPKPVD